ncbi:uncharacterized protein LOC103102508 isoform X2 [Monodelphis domestica]|uniref:uncharacterized protein LOC103102508 isoform X2 n=1 Tax=Monodelphis domestica TaxID=13616 RepID=UPI0024E21797|nr:uncharacterized protein LOC103102508 isoform X2 [Monodelphis domestica]
MSEQMSHLHHQARITPKSPLHPYYYQNELVSSSWLKHLATARQLSQIFPRTKAIPLPHLHHQNMAKVSSSCKFQKVTSVLFLHNRHDIKAKVALKSFNQYLIPPLASKHQPEFPLAQDHLTKTFHLIVNLQPRNQQLPSPVFSDNKAKHSPLLGYGPLTEERTYPGSQGKDMPSVISVSQVKVTRRSKVKVATISVSECFDLRHTGTITPSLCLSHWSRTTASKTLDLDHWVQAKSPKMSYPDLHLRETASLLRCLDHHSRFLAAYSLHLNQRTRTLSPYPPGPKHWIKGTNVASPDSNLQSRTRFGPSQSFKSWVQRSVSHWATTTFVPLPLYHQMADIPAKQVLVQPTPNHQVICPLRSEHQAKHMTVTYTQVLIQQKQDDCEVMPQDLDYQETMLKIQAYWTTPPLDIKHNHTALPNYEQRTTPLSPRHQMEKEPDPKIQVILQPELDDLETVSLGPDHKDKIPHSIGQNQQATPSQGIIDPQNIILSSPEHQVTPLPSDDHHAEDIAVESSGQFKFHQELDEWEPLLQRGLNHLSSPPANNDHQAQGTPENPSAHITLKELYSWDPFWTAGLDYQTTYLPGNDHQAQDIPANHSAQVIFNQKVDKQESFWTQGLNNQLTPPPNNDHQTQDIPAKQSAQVIFNLKIDRQETFGTQGLNHQSIPPPNNDHQAQHVPEDSSVHITFEQEPDDQSIFYTTELDHQTTPSPGNEKEIQEIPDSNSEASLQQQKDEFGPTEIDKQSTILTDQVDSVIPTLKLNHNRTSPKTYEATTPSSHDDQASDVSGLKVHTTLQQELDERETFWPTVVDKQDTNLMDEVYWATSPRAIKYQNTISLDPQYEHIPSPSHRDQASDVSDLNAQATLQQEIREKETFGPLKFDKQTSTLTEHIYWTTCSWDIKCQYKTLPDPHHGATPIHNHGDQALVTSDLNAQDTLQKETSKRETFWPTKVDKQDTVTLMDEVYWATPTLNLKHQCRTSPDPYHETTPLPSHEDQASDVSDFNDQATLDQEIDKWEAFEATGLVKQATTPKIKVYLATSPCDIKHQGGTSTSPHHEATPLPSPGDQASDVSNLNTQATFQQEQGKKETFWPIKFDKPATTVTEHIYWTTSPGDIKHQDKTSFDPQCEHIPSSSYGDQASAISDLNAQATFQQEIGKREIFWPTKVDKQDTVALMDEVYWEIPTLKHQDRTLPDPYHEATPLPSHEDQASDVSDFNDQATLDQEIDEWEAFGATELVKQATTPKIKVYLATSPCDIKHQGRTSTSPHHETTPLPSHEDQVSDVSDFNDQATLDQEIDEWEAFGATEFVKQATTPKIKVYLATSPCDIKHQGRTSTNPHHEATPLPSHGDQASDVSNLNTQATFQQEQGKRETFWPIKFDKPATTVTEHIYWTTSPGDIKHQDKTSFDPQYEHIPSSSHEDEASAISDLNAQATFQQEEGKREIFWPTKVDNKQDTMALMDEVYWAISTLKHQARTPPGPHHEATPLPSPGDQASDVSNLNTQATFQQEQGKRETFWPINLDKAATTVTEHIYWTTSPGDIKHQDKTSFDPQYEHIPSSSHEDEASAISDLNAQATFQQEEGKREIFWPTKVDNKQDTMALMDEVYWAISTLKHQARTPPGPHHEATPLPSHGDQASDVSNLNTQATFQQEQGKRETFWPINLDKAATIATGHVYWTTSPGVIKHQDKTLFDPQYEHIPSSSHEGEASAISDLNAQAIFQQEEGKREIFWPTKVDNKQDTMALMDEVYWAISTLKHQARTPPGPHHEATPLPSHGDQASDVSNLNTQATFQQEQGKRETFWPINLDKAATIATGHVYWTTSPGVIKHQDKTSLDSQCEHIPSPSHGDQASAKSDLNAQATFQQEQGKREIFWPTEVDNKQDTTALLDEVYWAIPTLKHQDRTPPDPHHEVTPPPPSHEDEASDISDLSAQATFQQEQGKRETFWPIKFDKLATTVTEHVYWITSPWDIKHQEKSSLDPQSESIPSSSHSDQALVISDLNAQATFEQEIGKREIFWPTEVDKQDTTLMDEDTTLMDEDTTLMDEDTTLMDEDTTLMDEDTTLMDEDTTLIDEDTTLMDEVYWATPTFNLKHPDRTSPDLHREAASSPNYDDQASDVSDLSAQAILQQELGKKETFWSTKVDKQDTTLMDEVYWATPSYLKHQYRTSPDLHREAASSPSYGDQTSDVSDLIAQAVLQKGLGKRETFWLTEVDKQDTTLMDEDYWTIPTLNLKHQCRTSPDCHHEATSPPSYGYQASDISVTFQEEIDEWETFWPIEVDKAATTLMDEDYWATSPLDLKHHNRISPDLHHEAIPPSSHGDLASNISDLSVHTKFQQEQGKRETFWLTKFDKQVTTPQEQFCWSTSWDMKYNDSNHEATFISSHGDKASEVSDLSVPVTLKEEIDDWETFWPIEVDKQDTTLMDEVYWETSILDLKHQSRTSPNLHHEITPPPSHDDQALKVSNFSVPVTLQEEIDEWETFWPTEVDKRGTTLNRPSFLGNIPMGYKTPR